MERAIVKQVETKFYRSKLSRYRTNIASALIAVTALALFGCTTSLKVNATKVVNYPAQEKLPLTVELRMADEFRHSTWKDNVLGGGLAVPLGEHLALNTEECARAIFRSVVSGSGGKESPPASGVSAILIPRLVDVDVLIPGGGASKVVTTMTLEWSMFDRSGKLIWVDSFKAESRGPIHAGGRADKNIQKRFDLMFADIFSQAYRAMVASREIRGLARNLETER